LPFLKCLRNRDVPNEWHFREIRQYFVKIDAIAVAVS
jgi:hypothetical protein